MSKTSVNFNVNPFVVHAFDGDNNKGGATLVAYPCNPDDGGKIATLDKAKTVYIAIAQCSRKDNFSRKAGLKLAKERAENGDGMFVRLPFAEDGFYANRSTLQALANTLAL